MTVEHELIKATGIGKAGGEPRQAFLIRLLIAASPGHLSDDAWAELAGPAQDWVNAATLKHNDHEPLPEFPDSEEVGEGRCRRSRNPRHRPSQPRCQKNIGVTTEIKLTLAASMPATGSFLRPRNGSQI